MRQYVGPVRSEAALSTDDVLFIVGSGHGWHGQASTADVIAVACDRVAVALDYARVEFIPAGGAGRSIFTGGSAWGQIIDACELGLPAQVPDVAQRPELRLPGMYEWRAAAFAPVLTRGRLLGCLCGFRELPSSFPPDQLAALQEAARVLAVALDRSEEAGSSVGHEVTSPSEELLRRIDAAQRRLGEIAAADGGDPIDGVCGVLAAELKSSVLVWDVPGSKARAFAGDPGFRSEAAELLTARDPLRLMNMADGAGFGPSHAYRIGRDRTFGLLLIEGAEARAGVFEESVIRLALALLAYDMESERSDHTARNVSRPSILHALVSGRLSARQAHDVGAVVDASGQRLRIGFLRVSDDVTATTTSHRLNFSRRTRGCLAAAAERDGVLLLLEDDDIDKLSATVEGLLATVSPGQWALGVSEPFVELYLAEAALAQAHTALASAGTCQIAFHELMGPTVALLKHMPPGSVRLFVDEMLRPLVDYDEEHSGALVETLASYLRHRGSLRKAADELFVHSNTVQLRLARASKLIGVDLHDPRQIGVLALAFAWRNEDQR